MAKLPVDNHFSEPAYRSKRRAWNRRERKEPELDSSLDTRVFSNGMSYPVYV